MGYNPENWNPNTRDVDLEWLAAIDRDRIEELKRENEFLRELVRRLEKSNEKLGLENHRLKGEGKGWNKNVTKG